MKKTILLLVLVLSLVLFACDADSATESKEASNEAVSLSDSESSSDIESEQGLEYTVEVRLDIEESITLIGGDKIQKISPQNPDFEEIKIYEALGYKYLYYELDGVKHYEDTIALDTVNDDVEIVVYAEYASYEIPIVEIDTNGRAIASDADYVDMALSLVNTDEEINRALGKIRVRGNTTSDLAKKPYKISFEDRQSLLGLTCANDWVLLAEYLDPSALHNYTALYLGNESDYLSFTPTAKKVNVYINGVYNGLYTLCEHIDEQKGRVDIVQEITADMTELKEFNFRICMDAYAVTDADAVLDETYFYISEHDRYFELKYPEKMDFTSEEQFDSFMTQLKDYTKELMDAFASCDLDKIKAEVNIGSLIDFCIIDQIMGETDHLSKSFNMYYTCTSENEAENNRLNFGPIWDYDWVLHTPWTGRPNEYYTAHASRIIFSNVFFQAIPKSDELYSLLKERYIEKFSPLLDDYISRLDLLADSMRQSLMLNHQKWYSYNQSLTDDNINFLKLFLTERKAFLDESWQKETKS